MEMKEQLQTIITNQELLIAMLHDIKQAQPTLNIAETAKVKDYRNEYNTGR